jgi:hypothetical protein
MTSFKRDAGATESEPPRTTPDNILVMGMIWQDEIVKDRKRREWMAFYAGCAVGAAVLAFSLLFLMRLTGGVCP